MSEFEWSSPKFAIVARRLVMPSSKSRLTPTTSKLGSDFGKPNILKIFIQNFSCFEDREVHFVSEQPEVLFFSDSIALDYEVSFKLRYIQGRKRRLIRIEMLYFSTDNGVLPPPTLPPPTSTWVPGVENRGFRGQVYTGGPIENFILNAIPKIRYVLLVCNKYFIENKKQIRFSFWRRNG